MDLKKMIEELRREKEKVEGVIASNNLSLRLLKPPEVLGGFNYLMAWHPRMNTDAAHMWLRSAIRETGKALSSRRG